MNPENFIQDYELALASQDWDNVAPLIHENACVTFSDGSVHKGIVLIAEAYKRNFSLIKNEQYSISDIHWINVDEGVAVYLFKFTWKGIINGQEASGFGRGTAVIIFEGDQWKLVAEHLGPSRA
ncbi:MAG: hypothetical protein JWO03_2360 [Bacteroidetes bacterium]|nr:hypothetical protein [Bacteroidota bacterium]